MRHSKFEIPSLKDSQFFFALGVTTIFRFIWESVFIFKKPEKQNQVTDKNQYYGQGKIMLFEYFESVFNNSQ